MKFHLFNSYFLSFILFASYMWMESDAINIDDMVRLYRLEGDYDDDGSSSKHLSASGAIGFASETPYGHVSGSSSRQVAHLSATGAVASTDGTGLPSGAASRTMLGWFKQSSTSNWAVPFGYGAPAAQQSWHLVLQYNVIKMDYYQDSENIPDAMSYSLDTWYHVAVSYDGTTNIRVHVNGELKAQGGIPIPVPNTSTSHFKINWLHLQTAQNYLGYEADVAVFNRALSTAEIAAIYNAPEGLKSRTNTVAGDSCLTGSSTPPEGLACDVSTNTYKIANGGACSINGDCASGTCDSNICKVSDAGTCSIDTDCVSGSCESNSCKVSDAGTCANDTDCASGTCDSSSCLISLGNNCSGASNCASSFCVSSVCTDGANGSACVSNTDCTSAYCGTSTHLCATPPVLDPCAGNNCSGHGRCYATSASSSRCRCENTFVEVMNGNKPTCSCPTQTELNPDTNRCISTTSPLTKSPSKMPTKSPTNKPTVSMTASPTKNDLHDKDCVDSSLAMKITINGELKNKFCTWVARKKTESRCAIDTVSSHCPITCVNYGGNCSVDSTARIKFTKEDGSNVMRYCTWIASKPNERCEYDNAVETCRNTCKEFSVRAV